ncbi:MAG: hypothetical protein E6706_06230 [Anaerococcus hydrogenalis]|nr:hypothetical protein [Anaerococcus hydrogenalis]
MKKFRKLLAVLAIAIFTFTACSIEGQDTKDNSSNTKKEEKAKEGKLKVGVSLSTLNNPFFVSIREGVEEAAKDKDVETVITDAQKRFNNTKSRFNNNKSSRFNSNLIISKKSKRSKYSCNLCR